VCDGALYESLMLEETSGVGRDRFIQTHKQALFLYSSNIRIMSIFRRNT